MTRLHTLRRFPMTLATLALLVVPFGCGSSDNPAPTSADVPTPPTAVADSQPTDPGFAPTPLSATAQAEMPPTVDPSVRQAAGELKGEATKDAAEARKEAREAEGDVKKAVEDTENEAKEKAKAVEAEARKAAEDALDKLLPSPK